MGVDWKLKTPDGITYLEDEIKAELGAVIKASKTTSESRMRTSMSRASMAHIHHVADMPYHCG